MFDLLSTRCAIVAQQHAPCEYEHMVHKLTVAEKIAEIERACGFTKKNQLAKLLGLSPQGIDNWRKRGWTKDAMILLPEKTGVDPRWMNDQSSVAFPDGVKVKPTMTIEQRLTRSEADMDQARNAMAALSEALELKLPGITALFEAKLDTVAPSEAYAEKGFHGLLAAWLEHTRETAEAAQAISPAAEARKSAARKHARKDRT